jgi:hypothetical protein
MNESQTNFPSATEAAPALPSAGTNEAATSAPDTQFSPPVSSDAVEMFGLTCRMPTSLFPRSGSFRLGSRRL